MIPEKDFLKIVQVDYQEYLRTIGCEDTVSSAGFAWKDGAWTLVATVGKDCIPLMRGGRFKRRLMDSYMGQLLVLNEVDSVEELEMMFETRGAGG